MNKVTVKKIAQKTPLYLIPMKGAKTATLMFLFNTGSKHETRENSGISHFLEHMFFKGTKKRPDTATISSDLDSLGCEFNAFTSKEYTGYYVKSASSKIRPAFSILGDMLLNSLFSMEEIEREKGVIIEELNMYEDNPLMHIEDVFETCLYGDTPAGWDTIGTKKNIKGFKREDFLNYFNTQYGKNSLSVVLAGNFSVSDVSSLESIINRFPDNDWQNKLAVIEKQTKPEIKVLPKKVDQVTMSLGLRTLAMGSPWELKLKLLSLILGGSMSSRLFIKLRERNGLAYFVKTSTEFYTDTGYLSTQAGVPANKAQEAARIIIEEYQRVKDERISPQELKKAKDLLIGRMALRLESSDEVASWYSKQAVLKAKIKTPAGVLAEIKKITAADLQKTAKKFFLENNLNLALIGKAKADSFANILKLK